MKQTMRTGCGKAGDGMEFDTIWREYDLDSFQSGIRRLFPEYGISLEKLLGFVMSGDLKGGILYLGQRGIGGVTEQIGAIKNIFVWLLVMGIVSALFIQFADVFDRNQIADISFYYVYLTVSYVLLECFLRASQIAVSTMENVILFVKLLVPTYLFAVGIAGGAAEAVSSSQLLILTIFGVENLLQRILIPIIYSYVFLTLVNCVWTEEKLSLLMELLKKNGHIKVITFIDVILIMKTNISFYLICVIYL